MEIRGLDFVVYQVGDIERSIAFYRDTLGLEMGAYEENFGWAEFDAPPTTLALYAPDKMQPGTKPQTGGGSVALAVADVDAALEELRGKGVPVVMEKFESPVCWYALVADPDGNAVGIHQRKDGTCC